MTKSPPTLRVFGWIILVIVGFLGAVFFVSEASLHLLLSFNPSDVPLITANPVQFKYIFSISKFRSDAGHDYSMNSWDGETCRSMKHYFNWSQKQIDGMPVRSQPTPNHPNIAIYAPFSGTITKIMPENIKLGKQIFIASAKNPAFYVRLFHTDLLPNLSIGNQVSSGEQIGTIGPMDGTDVSYEAIIFPFKTIYLSIFQYMTPVAFSDYAKLGYKPSDFILTKQQADNLNYQCSGEQFVHPSDFYTNPQNQLEGYVSLRPNPYANQANLNQDNNYQLTDK